MQIQSRFLGICGMWMLYLVMIIETYWFNAFVGSSTLACVTLGHVEFDMSSLMFCLHAIFISGEPGGYTWQADHSSVDGEDVVASTWSDGSDLRRIHLREVLPASRWRDQWWAILAERQVHWAVDATSLQHRSRLCTHHPRYVDSPRWFLTCMSPRNRAQNVKC